MHVADIDPHWISMRIANIVRSAKEIRRQPPICDQYYWARLGTNVSLGWLRSPGR
jgi:hypothetical protein